MSAAEISRASRREVPWFVVLMIGLIAFDVEPCADWKNKNNNNKLLQSAFKIDLNLWSCSTQQRNRSDKKQQNGHFRFSFSVVDSMLISLV